MTLSRNSVWVKFMTLGIVLAFILSGAVISLGAPQSTSILPAPGEGIPSYVPGTEWVKFGVVLDVGPAMEENQVVFPSVLKLQDGSYAMWYQALGNDGHQRIMKAVEVPSITASTARKLASNTLSS